MSERIELKNKRAKLEMSRRQYAATAQGLCTSIRRELNTNLVPLDDQETASASLMMDRLMVCMGEYADCSAKLMRLDMELE